MHLDLTDEQAEAVRSSLFFSLSNLRAYLDSPRAKHQEQRDWATNRAEQIETLLAMFSELAR